MDNLTTLLTTLEVASARLALSKKEWARAAGVPAETLSRLTHRQSCDLSTLSALSRAVGMRVAVVPQLPREMPDRWGREEEDRVLTLCATSVASGKFDLAAWLAAGPRYFMGGLAVMVASLHYADRPTLLLLADTLYPGATTRDEFGRWLDLSPAKPSRFLASLGAIVHSGTGTLTSLAS